MEREPVVLKVDGLDIVGELYRPASGGVFPCLCICHGIPSGDAPDPNDRGYPGLAEYFCEASFSVFIFNFRGTGLSQGNFDMAGWMRDLESVIDYLWQRPEVDQERLSVMGFSGGAMVSVTLAARDERVSALAACACPAEMGVVVRSQENLAWLERCRNIGIIRDPDFPPSLEEWQRGFAEVSAIRWIDRIAPRPLLLLYGEDDEMVGRGNATRLYEKAQEPKELIVIPGAGHRLRHSQRAMAAALDWLKVVNGLD